ncbi:unnamed protein product [Moneuplotes crassus]|uniref:Uncharacterized protein n=1 Tax=Euplotes crassus TaxID=5936 RepID=A0AAD1U4V0_EUPCR|nr:unnamed protein product [Moneuplotes crassus]
MCGFGMPFVCTCTEYQNKCHHAEPEVRTTTNLGEQETFRETESQVKCSFCQSKSSSGQDLPSKIHSRNEASRILQFESEIIQRCEPEFATVTAKQLHTLNEGFQASCRTNEVIVQTKRVSSNTLQHQSTDRASREQLELGADITLPRSEFNEFKQDIKNLIQKNHHTVSLRLSHLGNRIEGLEHKIDGIQHVWNSMAGSFAASEQIDPSGDPNNIHMSFEESKSSTNHHELFQNGTFLMTVVDERLHRSRPRWIPWWRLHSFYIQVASETGEEDIKE